MKHRLFILIFLAFTCGILAASDAETPADTFNGQSVGPDLSADDANAYVDSVVKAQLSKNGSAGSKLDMNAASGAISDIKRLGIANLVSSYGQTKGDVLYVVDATLDRSDEMKRGILEKALSQSATSADIDALLGLYDAHPLILEVLVEHPEWDSDPRVTDFLVAKLDQIPDAYKKSDLAPGYLLTLAARNTSTAVQSKWDSFLTDATNNDSHYPNGHLFVELVTTYARTGSPIIAKHLSDIFTVLGNRVKSSTSDPFNEISLRDFFLQVQWALQFGTTWKGNITTAAAALFGDQKTKDTVTKLAGEIENNSYNGIAPTAVLVPAAACGDKAALKKLAELAHDPNGNIANMAKKYLTTINCPSASDKLTQVIDHIDAAAYDPALCAWTIAVEKKSETNQ